jgi:two-component system sensor histidine kinase BaeS
LPALFLAGVLVSGLVATVVSIELFQKYTRDRAYADMRRESLGLVKIYALNVNLNIVPSRQLEEAVGDRVFHIPRVPGFSLFLGKKTHLRELPANQALVKEIARKHVLIYHFRYPGPHGTQYVGAARPVLLGGKAAIGAIVVARPQSALTNRWLPLTERLLIAFAVALVVSTLFAWYLGRRITRPLRRLSEAADEIAAGRYAVSLPQVPRGDEIGHLSERFGQMAARLVEAEELERNFLMSVSHELRTPLTAIRGHVAALREGVFDDPYVRDESLAVVAQETARLERLVGDVLDLAKLDAHRFTIHHEEVDMAQLCGQAYAAFGEEARQRSIEYRQELRAEPVIVTDGDRVLQVISNLLANAFRWTPAGGRIELMLDGDEVVTVEVRDSGPGITDEERERIFRPFWSRDGGGTGLGLAIARELALALGGSIELESEPGEGSTFRLVLPGGRARPPAPEPFRARVAG